MGSFMKQVFVMGFLSNFFIRFGILFLPGATFCIAGIWINWCLVVGLLLLILDAALSLLDQISIYRGAKKSTNQEFLELWNAANAPNGRDKLGRILEAKIANAKSIDPEEE